MESAKEDPDKLSIIILLPLRNGLARPQSSLKNAAYNLQLLGTNERHIYLISPSTHPGVD